jgi:putative pyoverdin transport system ATP-binding/permease protein
MIKHLMQLLIALVQWSKGVRHSRASIVLATLLGGVAGMGTTALIAVINAALAGSPGSSKVLVAKFIGLCVVIPVSGFLSRALLLRLTAEAAYQLRMELSRQILAAPLRLLETLGVHRLLAAITDDIPTVTGAVTSLPLLLTHFAIIAGCLIYLGWLSRPLLLFVLGYMLLGVLTHQLPFSRAYYYFKLLREQWDALFKGIQGVTSGTKELKLNRRRRRAFVSEQLEPAAQGIRRYGVLGNLLALVASVWGELSFFIFIGLILFVAPQLFHLTRQVVTGYTLTALFMISPLGIILNNMPVLERAHVAAMKIKELGLSLTASPPEQSGAIAEPDVAAWRKIEMIGVSHVYWQEGGGEEFHLGPIDLTFLPGEMVFVIGGNGSGKTTLAKLIMGLYEPEAGEIRLDGKVITLSNRDDYRQHFAAVFADFYLFDRLFGVTAEDLDAMSGKYLNQLELSHKVRLDKGRLSTIDLSHGQRKRLALLNAYLEDRPIYIFDEWASDQDPMFKQVFYHQLLPELKARGKTVIVITHDDRYYHLANRVIKLDSGQIEYDRHMVAHHNDLKVVSAPHL